MRTRIIIVSVLVLLLALPAAVSAQATDPLGAAEGFSEAVNKGDVDEAMTYMDPAAAARTDQGITGTGEPVAGAPPPPASTDPPPQYSEVPKNTYTGEEQIRGWIEGMVALNADIALGECVVEGERVTCPANYVDDALRVVGVPFVAGELEIEVSEGAITALSFTPTAESVAAVQAAAAGAPETLPVSGGGSPFPYALVVALAGLLMVTGGLGMWSLQSRSRRVY